MVLVAQENLSETLVPELQLGSKFRGANLLFAVNPTPDAIIPILLGSGNVGVVAALPSGLVMNRRSGFKNRVSKIHCNRRITVKDFRMNGTEEKIRYAIGSAAAAAAIFAPLAYKWKGVLTGVAAGAILTAVYGVSPVRRLLG